MTAGVFCLLSTAAPVLPVAPCCNCQQGCQQDYQQVLELVVHCLDDPNTLFRCCCVSTNVANVVHSEVRVRLPSLLAIVLQSDSESARMVSWLSSTAGPEAMAAPAVARVVLELGTRADTRAYSYAYGPVLAGTTLQVLSDAGGRLLCRVGVAHCAQAVPNGPAFVACTPYWGEAATT